MLQILSTSVKIGKLQVVPEIQKKSVLGGLGSNKRFNVLYFTNANVSFLFRPSIWYGTIKFLRVKKPSEFKITGVISRKLAHTKTAA